MPNTTADAALVHAKLTGARTRSGSLRYARRSAVQAIQYIH